MRNLRLSRYTPQAANEIRTWIEETLEEKLPGGDLLEVLKDGTVLCKYEIEAEIVPIWLLITLQASQPSPSPSRYQVQKVSYALYADGEHIALSSRL